MASLTDYLPMVNDGKKIIQPYDKGPSIFEGLVDFAGNAMKAQEGANETNRQRAAAKRQADKDALEASDRGAGNLVAEQILTIGTLDRPDSALHAQFTGGTSQTNPNVTAATPPMSEAETQEVSLAAQAGDAVGQKAERLQNGLNQGRLSAANYEMLVEDAMRDAFAKFPNSKMVVLETMSKYAINHPIMSEYRNLAKSEEDQAASQAKREEEAITFALQNGTPADSPRSTLIAAGYRLQSAKNELETSLRIASEQRAQKTATDADRKAVNDAHGMAVSKFVHSSLAPQLNAGIDTFSSIMSDTTIPEPQRIKAAGEFIRTFQPKAYSLIENVLTQGIANGMTMEQAEAERKVLRQRVDDIFVQFDPSNPLNIIDLNGKIMKNMSDKLNLDMLEVAPVFTQMKMAFGGNSEAVNSLMETIMSDPKLQSVFTREIKGFQGLAQGDQTVRLRNLIAFVTDQNTSLKDYSPQESRQILNDSKALLEKGFYQRAQAGDEASQRTVLGTLGKVANAAVDVAPGGSTAENINIIRMLGNQQAYNTLRASLKGGQGEFAGLVGDEMRVAAGKSLMGLIGQNQSVGNGWKWAFDDRNRRFVIVRPKQTEQGQFSDVGPGNRLTLNEGAPPLLRAQVQAMNQAKDFLMGTSDIEDNPALKNATADQKWRFYSRGELPPQPKAKENQSGRERISRLQNYWENVKIDWSKVPKIDIDAETERVSGREVNSRVQFNEDGSRTAKNLAGKTITIPPTNELSLKHAENPVFQTLLAEADANGVPREVAIRLGFVESGGKYNDPGTNRAGASGPLQVTGKNYDSLSQQIFGKKVADLSPAENVKLGMRILADNYKKRGSWQEAANDYIGRGEDDGNIRSRDYAKLIGG